MKKAKKEAITRIDKIMVIIVINATMAITTREDAHMIVTVIMMIKDMATAVATIGVIEIEEAVMVITDHTALVVIETEIITTMIDVVVMEEEILMIDHKANLAGPMKS